MTHARYVGPSRGRLAWMLLLAACTSVLSVACDAGTPQPPPGTVELTAEDENPLRLVSLAPALTRILVDLDMGDYIVGVGSHDAAAPEGARVVGPYNDVNSEALLSLRPTHVLLMVGEAGVPQQIQSLSESQGFQLITYPYPKTVDDVARIIIDNREIAPIESEGLVRLSLGTAMGIPLKAQDVQFRMLETLSTVRRVTDNAPTRSVLLVFSTNPVMASGDGSVLDSILYAAGGINALDDDLGAQPELDRETITKLRPDVIVLLSPGDQPLESLKTDARLATFRGLEIPAVENNAIRLIDHPLVLLPSTSLAEIAPLLAKAIHPELADKIDAAIAAAASEREALAADPSGDVSIENVDALPEETPVDELPVDQPVDEPTDADASQVSSGQ